MVRIVGRQLSVVFIVWIFLGRLPSHVFSQETASGIGISVSIADEGAELGHLVSFKGGEYRLSREAYDNELFGVIADPVASIEDTTLDDFLLVVSEGDAIVKVTSKNGKITKGDYLTSSEIPGVAQRADRPGMIVGVALEDYSSDSTEVVSEIFIHVDIRSQRFDENITVNLIEALRGGLEAPFLTPIASLRYILAAIVVAGSFMLAFFSFGRTSGKGVEALGRNPLAKRVIQGTIIFNFVLTIIILLVGLLLAYMILVL